MIFDRYQHNQMESFPFLICPYYLSNMCIQEIMEHLSRHCNKLYMYLYLVKFHSIKFPHDTLMLKKQITPYAEHEVNVSR